MLEDETKALGGMENDADNTDGSSDSGGADSGAKPVYSYTEIKA